MAITSVSPRARVGSARFELGTSALALPLIIGAAAIGVVEVTIHRVASTVAAGVGAPSWLGETITVIGRTSMAATAILTAIVAIVLAVTRNRRQQVAMGMAAVAVLIEPFATSGLEWVPRVVLMLAAGTIALTDSQPAGRRAPLLLIAGGFVAGQAALVWTAIGLGLRSAGEAALLAGILLLAVMVVSDHEVEMPGWLSAVAVGSVAAFAFGFQPGYTALTAVTAWGGTLWLPPLFYIAAAAALGLLLMTWIRNAEHHLAAGLVLLVVAGLPPVLTHHNLTAVVALAALSTTHWPSSGRSVKP